MLTNCVCGTSHCKLPSWRSRTVMVAEVSYGGLCHQADCQWCRRASVRTAQLYSGKKSGEKRPPWLGDSTRGLQTPQRQKEPRNDCWRTIIVTKCPSPHLPLSPALGRYIFFKPLGSRQYFEDYGIEHRFLWQQEMRSRHENSRAGPTGSQIRTLSLPHVTPHCLWSSTNNPSL